MDNLAIRDTHSLFFQDLESKFNLSFSAPELTIFWLDDGYTVDFKVLNYDNFKIQEFGEYHYDQLIVFCTSVSGILPKAIAFQLTFSA